MNKLKYRVLRWLVVVLTLSAIAAVGISADSISQAAITPEAAASDGRPSMNWSGYVASGQTFTKVTAKFRVARVTCTAPNSMAIAWVGLDGFGKGKSVEQTGIWAYCDGGAHPKPHYVAFWQMYPTTQANPTSFTVLPGDEIRATVTYSTLENSFALNVQDVSDGRQYTKQVTCAVAAGCARNSAEWVVERPDNTGNVAVPLADWGVMAFSGAMAATGEVYQPLSAYDLTRLNIMSDGDKRELTSVSQLGPNGDSFNDTRLGSK